jgi:hypothetical protein
MGRRRVAVNGVHFCRHNASSCSIKMLFSPNLKPFGMADLTVPKASYAVSRIADTSSPAERDFAVLNLPFCGNLDNRSN